MKKNYVKMFFEIVKHPCKMVTVLSGTNFFNWMPDEIYLKLYYQAVFNRKLNLDDPHSFNEKLQWLKLYDRNEKYARLVDKYAVRKYISEKLGSEYLIPLLGGPWRSVEEIPFDSLPNEFVLKTTHDSGGIVVCRDKSKLDIDAAKKKLRKSLIKNYYYHGREWVYKGVKPQIIAEKFITDDDKDGLTDYKFMCFNGKHKCSFVCENRNSTSGLKVTFYDKDWNVMPFERKYPRNELLIPKPYNYGKMIRLAEKLSEDLPFARIDFYEVDKKIYFGEITFFPGNGFEKFRPEEWDYKLGEWIELPKYK